MEGEGVERMKNHSLFFVSLYFYRVFLRLLLSSEGQLVTGVLLWRTCFEPLAPLAHAALPYASLLLLAFTSCTVADPAV